MVEFLNGHAKKSKAATQVIKGTFYVWSQGNPRVTRMAGRKECHQPQIMLRIKRRTE